MSALARLIQSKRIERGLTQFQLAEKMDTTQSAVSYWEGSRSKPSNVTLLRSVLGISKREYEDALTENDPVVEAIKYQSKLTAENKKALLTYYHMLVESDK